ncbi:MAG: hypothetical protein IMW89_05485 [Ktedonobacteraceae bacterium]|nr:hypothetical protein [Ktedonobacteraceae bacterium]
MKKYNQLQTIAVAYAEICQGEEPWVALGNFMNDWFDYAKNQRELLVADPVVEPESATPTMHRWAAFCAASVEWLCQRYGVSIPAWVSDPRYVLPDPWFDSPGAHKPEVRKRLIQRTPEPFARRNIFCGNRMFLNKYELAESYSHLSV